MVVQSPAKTLFMEFGSGNREIILSQVSDIFTPSSSSFFPCIFGLSFDFLEGW